MMYSIFVYVENAGNPYKQRGNCMFRYGVYLFLYIQSVFYSILWRQENVCDKPFHDMEFVQEKCQGFPVSNKKILKLFPQSDEKGNCIRYS